MQDFNFISLKTLQEVCQALSETGGKVIAGGTDVIPQMNSDHLKTEWLIDLSRVPYLNYIREKNGLVEIGALTTYAEIIVSPLLRSSAEMLIRAARTVGSVQTRHRGTIGGNIANASPAGDMLPPLLALDAIVTLKNRFGERSLPLAELLLGPGRTTIGSDEVILHVGFKKLPEGTRAKFIKLGNRFGMAISVVSIALVLNLDEDRKVEKVSIALGAVAPATIRSVHAERLLFGQRLNDELIAEAGRAAAAECSPIDDVRATAAYRRHAVRVLVQRGLLDLAHRENKGSLWIR